MIETFGSNPDDPSPEPIRVQNPRVEIVEKTEQEHQAAHLEALKRYFRGIVQIGFHESRLRDVYYDPLDDETLAKNKVFNTLINSEKKAIAADLKLYILDMEQSMRGKHAAIQSLGAQALEDESATIPIHIDGNDVR